MPSELDFSLSLRRKTEMHMVSQLPLADNTALKQVDLIQFGLNIASQVFREVFKPGV